jgi:hypothetical protein
MKHRDQVLELLQKQIGNASEVTEIRETAEAVGKKWVDPLSGGREETNGLIYGLVQSGKTGVLTVTGAVGADEGYKTIIILTSDNNPLYEQTLLKALLFIGGECEAPWASIFRTVFKKYGRALIYKKERRPIPNAIYTSGTRQQMKRRSLIKLLFLYRHTRRNRTLSRPKRASQVTFHT